MDFDDYATAYLPAHKTTTIDLPDNGLDRPSIVINHGPYTAVLNPMPVGDHLCIDVHAFVNGHAARAGTFGMENGRRVDGFTDAATHGTSHRYPATRLVAVLIGEQADKPAAGDAAEMQAAVDFAVQAGRGDSADAEIAALQSALSTALARWPDVDGDGSAAAHD
jgi:hypothetical protein